MGFCVFNSAAVAVAHARQALGCERVAVLDWDAHHGNGTQAIFYDDPAVLYVSLHQYPFYPGTGAAAETGAGAGAGATVNLPLAAGTSESAYLAAFHAPALAEMATALREPCGGPALVLEGGYSLSALEAGVTSVLRAVST